MTTTFSTTRSAVSRGCVDEYDVFAALIESLDDTQWNASSRCAGWLVRDVAGHVVGLAEDTAAGKPGSRNSDEEAASVRHETPVGAAARLRAAVASIGLLLDSLDDDAWAGPSGLPDLSLGDGVLTLWYDTYVHADDIRAAIGEKPELGLGVQAAVAYLAAEHAKRDIAAVDVSRVDAHDFVLAATGRIDPTTIGLDPEVNIYAD